VEFDQNVVWRHFWKYPLTYKQFQRQDLFRSAVVRPIIMDLDASIYFTRTCTASMFLESKHPILHWLLFY
jgi:hypothetical protein